MASRRMLVIGGVTAGLMLVAAVVAAAAVSRAAHRPHLDPAARAAVPTIDAYLPTRAAGTWDGPLAQRRPGQARWYCRADPIESRHTRDGLLRVGVMAQCGEYLRDGDRLTVDAAYASPLVVVLQPRGSTYVPVRAAHPGDGTRFAWSVKKMFTANGARAAMRAATDGDFPDPAPDARRGFGLPADAPIVQG